MRNREAEAAPGPSSGAIVDFLNAVGTYCDRPNLDLSSGQLAQELIELRHACDRLELEFSLSAARFAATNEYEAQGSGSPISWIRHQCRMSGHAAAERVRVGEEAERLPQSVEAINDGRIGFATSPSWRAPPAPSMSRPPPTPSMRPPSLPAPPSLPSAASATSATTPATPVTPRDTPPTRHGALRPGARAQHR